MRIDALPVLVLHPHSRCNCRCTMCDIWKNTTAEEISVDMLGRQMEAISRLRVRWVVLSGGEALMHSDLWGLIATLRACDVRISLLTSGLLLQRCAAAIARHIDDVIVSLDGPAAVHNRIRGVPGAYQATEEGISALRELRPGIMISARCTVQRGNFGHLVETLEAAHELDLDSVSFLAADLDSTAFRRLDGWPPEKKASVGLTGGEIVALEEELDRVVLRGECGGFVREPAAKLRRIAAHFRATLGEIPHTAPTCNAPWKSAVIEADGAVRPCFFHPAFGNLNSGLSLEQILNGPKAIAFRNSLDVQQNPVCRKCVCSLNWKQNP